MLICGPFNSDLIPLSRAAYTKLFYIERRSFYSPHDFIIIAHYYILFSSLAFLLHCSLKSIDIWLLPASNVFLSFFWRYGKEFFSCTTTTTMMKWEYKSVFFLLLLESCKRFFPSTFFMLLFLFYGLCVLCDDGWEDAVYKDG